MSSLPSVIIPDRGAPVRGDRRRGADLTDRLCNGVIEDFCSLPIGAVVYCPVRADSETGGIPLGVDIRREEEKLPAGLYFFVFDHAPDPRGVIRAAGVLSEDWRAGIQEDYKRKR